jgi:hypothetical protein
MQLQTLIINKINASIRVLLNKNNIVDFKNSDKTKLVSLDSFVVTIPGLKLAKKSKKGKLILFSNNKTSIKTSYFDEVNLIFSVNLESIFTNNNLQELITEYYDNHCSNIVNFVNKQLIVHRDALNEPDVTKNFEDLLMDIQKLATNTKNKKMEFFASQIPNFQKRFEQLQVFEKKKINKFFKTQMIQESSNFVKILTQDSQIEEVIDKLVKKLSKLTSYSSTLRYLHKYKRHPVATATLKIKHKVISVNFALNIEDEARGFSYLDIDAISIYINNLINFGEINSESDLEECINQFLNDYESYKGPALKRIIGSYITHEIQHNLNPEVGATLTKAKDERSSFRIRKRRLSRFVDIDKLKKEEDLEYSLDPSEIQARTAQLTYYLISRFKSLPKYRQMLKNLPQLYMNIPEDLKHTIDEVDPKIKNKVFREVYKHLKEKGYQ